MQFTFHQLKIFSEVVKQKSITRAAVNLNMTQPALSIQLKNFSSLFEFQLLERKGRSIKVTDYGMQIYQRSLDLLSKAEEMNYLTESFKNLEAGSLRIASVSTGKYIIPYIVADFLKHYPNVDLNIQVSNKEDVVNRLKDEDLDFALVSVLPSNVLVNEEVLFNNELYLVGNTPEFDSSRPLIYREKGSATRQAMDRYFKNSSSHKTFELTSNEAVKQAVKAGLGYSILPKIGITQELLEGSLHIIPQNKLPIVTQWRMVYNKQRILSPVAQTFLSYLKENKAEILKKYFSE
jgi:DNA-binding transcriptional LysR family regulator